MLPRLVLKNKSMLGRWLFLLCFLGFYTCTPDEPITTKGDLEDIEYKPESYNYIRPDNYPQLEYSSSNLPTVAGVELGRKLFYDPILSKDSSQGCFSCHKQEFAFSNDVAFSTGIDGFLGKRSSMSLVDVGFHTRGLFWDGRAADLEEQAAFPVNDVLELHFNWPDIEKRLQRSNTYPTLFRKAFGIKAKKEITDLLARNAISQFERTIVSSGTSKYDRVIAGKEVFDNDEFDGYSMFFDLGEGNPLLPDAQCAHCHNEPLLSSTSYFNNGLQESYSLTGFKDLGRGGITHDSLDNGKMKVTTLRNWKYTAPFMHNGSLKTMDDVLAHYSSGGKYSPNRDPLIRQIQLSPTQLRKLKAFLNTLNDEAILHNPAYSNPN